MNKVKEHSAAENIKQNTKTGKTAAPHNEDRPNQTSNSKKAECSADYMAAALEEAKKAARKGEVPIGAVIVCYNTARNGAENSGGKIIARAHNMRERRRNALAHAEILAIDKACRRLKTWRLDGCVMYVTLEPCPMCAGAALNARLKKVIAGAKSDTDLNWKTQIEFDPHPECSDILKDFFKSKRT